VRESREEAVDQKNSELSLSLQKVYCSRNLGFAGQENRGQKQLSG